MAKGTFASKMFQSRTFTSRTFAGTEVIVSTISNRHASRITPPDYDWDAAYVTVPARRGPAPRPITAVPIRRRVFPSLLDDDDDEHDPNWPSWAHRRQPAPAFLSYVSVTREVIWMANASETATGEDALERIQSNPGASPNFPGEDYLVEPPPCEPYTENPFRRLVVFYLVRGGARVSWEINRNFTDPTPHYFQLQASHASRVPTADDWVNVGAPVADTYYLLDPVRRLYGMTSTLAYRIVLTTPVATYTSPAEMTYTALRKEDWIKVREIMRKEELRHKLFSVRGWFLKARRYGTKCTECLDPHTDTVICTTCTGCYGTKFVGGYFPAVPCSYTDLDDHPTREHRNLNLAGTTKDVLTRGRFSGAYPMVQGDAFVAMGSDDRFYVHFVSEAASWKIVPLVLQVELRQAAYSDPLYDFPLGPQTS